MRLITYRRDATAGPALLKDGHVFPLTPLGYPDTLAFIAAGPKRWAGVNLQLEETGPNLLAPLSSVTLEAPLQRPAKILCIGLNYRDHAVESKMEPPKFPTVFHQVSARPSSATGSRSCCRAPASNPTMKRSSRS